jgi:hypothetical protein
MLRRGCAPLRRKGRRDVIVALLPVAGLRVFPVVDIAPG